jgi:thiol-disulfide isomerase/thioredoxin
MRINKAALGIALFAGLIVGTSFASIGYSQKAASTDAQASEKAEFDESLLEIPENQSLAFYQERYIAIQDSFQEFARTASVEELNEFYMTHYDAIKNIEKKVAFPDYGNENVSGVCFEKYTSTIAHAGKLDELKELLARDEAKYREYRDRVQLLQYYTLCLTLDEAGKSGENELKAAIKDVERALPEDDTVAIFFPKIVEIVSSYNQEEGDALLKRTVESFKASDSRIRQMTAESLEGNLRFVNLVGNDMVFEGVYDNGEEVDWSSYRGKVVLVIFWAPRSAPSVEEIPNLLALYSKYHNAGFDVLGYSLDGNLDALEKFEEERQLPWRTAVRKLSREANQKDGKNYTDLAEYYGVRTTPTMILVDKDGKVIDTYASGERLKELLEKAFPDVE